MKDWYIVYTKPRNEDVVSKKFLDIGLEVINPKFNERKCVRGRLQDVESHLFPCYIFLKFDLFKNYRLVKYTRGVKRVVGSEMPTVVPEEIIDSILDRMENGLVRINARRFDEGEEVLIKGGPFVGLNAVFEKEVSGPERVSILLKAINARVVVDSAFLERC